MNRQVWPGRTYPLGATWDGQGTNFALFSENATQVELCLFDDQGREERIPLPEEENYVWHAYLPGVQPGQLYGYRVYGSYDPPTGHRFNPAKLLIDPYAKAIAGEVQYGPELYDFVEPEPPLVDPEAEVAPVAPEWIWQMNHEDDAHLVPKCVVIDPAFDWAGDRPLTTPWYKTVIYELHVKGFTQCHPDLPPALRGTYAGLAHPVIIEYLQKLGVTAIELLPVHHFNTVPRHLVEHGLRNYWGYESLGYLAPHSSYSASGDRGEQVTEFKTMVKALHQAGIEVILDVVYNHTGEANHLGPTLAFRGLDNATYYRLMEEAPQYYRDFTGCGNSLNVRHPQILKLIMDSLRYWVLEMHVDGFRFDLASALARELFEVDSLAAFFDIIHQDPVLSTIKLIAEPWDVGEGGYQVGKFPLLWSEWNGKYRDIMRDLWRSEHHGLAEFAYRFTGSSDLYETNGRRPHASINFITSHDGFPLNDLVSYNHKHNLANGEENRDGENYNQSWNCGVEGETDDPAILTLRERQRRNFLATLLLSQGVPMVLAGDELGRTQRGNNNCYCQDNELSWIDWRLQTQNADLLEFTRQLIHYRRDHPVFRRRNWFQGREIHGSSVHDIGWFNPDGTEMTDEQWHDSTVMSLSIFLNGQEIVAKSHRGECITDDSYLLLFNPYYEPLEFVVPLLLTATAWQVVIDTTQPRWLEVGPIYPGDKPIALEERSLLVLRQLAPTTWVD